jgi:RNA polymerase sigma-70 factor (ECF subfamily)
MAKPDQRRSLDLWRAGNEGAARELFDCYAEKLLALARRRISQRLAGRVDPEDIVQSVFRTFFQRAQEGRFDFADPDDLGKLLVRITVHKTLRQVAFHKAAKRNPSLEVGQGMDTQQSWEEILDAEPSPDEAVTFLDELENFLTRLRPHDRQILELRLQGWSNEEICQELKIYDRKIRRVIERIRGLAEQEGLVSP